MHVDYVFIDAFLLLYPGNRNFFFSPPTPKDSNYLYYILGLYVKMYPICFDYGIKNAKKSATKFMQPIYFNCSAVTFPELKLLSHKLFTYEVNKCCHLLSQFVKCFLFQNGLPAPKNLAGNYSNCCYIKNIREKQ